MNHTQVGYKIARILKLKRQFLDLELNRIGLSRTQWQVLFGIIILNCRTQRELLKNLDFDPAYLARTLEKLEKLQYISRSPLKDDRRCLTIALTEYGKQYIAPHIETAIAKEETLLLQGFNATEQQQLLQLLLRVEKNIASAFNTTQDQE